MVTIVQEGQTFTTNSKFHIDERRVSLSNRSFQLLLLQRRCASCWGSLIQEPDSGRDLTASKHLSKIASHCAKTSDYISKGMPIAEAIFRLLLANRNKLMTIGEIYDGLSDRWVDRMNPGIPEPHGIYKIMTSDVFYGFAEDVS